MGKIKNYDLIAWIDEIRPKSADEKWCYEELQRCLELEEKESSN